MNNTLRLLRSVAFAIALSLPSYSHAQSLGDQIFGSGFTVPGSATIGAGVEFVGPSPYMGWDFGANTLTFTVTESGFSGIQFTIPFQFYGFDVPITGISIESNAGWSGTILAPTFTASSIAIDLTSALIDPLVPAPRAIVFNIQTSSSVPDCGATVAMLGSALGGLLALRRRLA